MTDDIKSLRDDIDYLKKVTAEGRSGPIGGGVYILAAGLVYGLAALGVWLELTGRLQLPAGISGQEFMVAMGLQIIFAIVTGYMQRNRVIPSRDGRLFRAVWTGLGLAIFAAALGVGISAARLQNAIPWMAFEIVAIAIYGGAWLVCGWLARHGWMLLVAAGCAVGAIVLGYTAGRTEQMLVFAVCLFLFAAIPGLAMMVASPGSGRER